MLMALLLGMPMHFLVAGKDSRFDAGLSFATKKVLRIGVALLGARISFDIFLDLGAGVVGLMVAALIATIMFGFAAAKVLGRNWRLAILTSGSVAICGASAAMAISAVLPNDRNSERNLTFTVFGVTLLSSLAMIAYPILAQRLDLGELASGIFLGGTIHDVAQVVGAGFSVSEEVGETSTTVKLIRVSLLAPFILVLTLLLRSLKAAGDEKGSRPPLLPFFIAAFLLLAVANSFGLVPDWLRSACWAVSKWALLAAVAAVGIKTELKKILEVPPQSIALIVGETAMIALVVLAGVLWFF